MAEQTREVAFSLEGLAKEAELCARKVTETTLAAGVSARDQQGELLGLARDLARLGGSIRALAEDLER